MRWAGLVRYEQEILSAISSPRNLPRTLDYPRWDDLLLCLDRIYDAVIHRELPYGQNGVTLNDESLFDSTELTIRHIDLKRWMRTHYPEHRPRFLFSRSEIGRAHVELQSLMRNSYAVFCLKKKNNK